MNKSEIIIVNNLINAGKYTLAESKLIELINNNPNDLSFKNSLAVVYASQKKFKESIKIFKQIIELSKDFIDPYINLGNIYNDLNQTKDSINYYNKALLIDPNHLIALYNLANVYDKDKQFQKASKIYSQLIKKQPNNISFLTGYSSNLIQINDFKSAKKLLGKILQLSNKNIEALINLGVIFKEENNLKKATDYFLKAYHINPKHPVVNYNLGTVFEADNKFIKAIKYLETAIKLEPNYTAAHFNLGCSYEKIGKKQEAFLSYNNAFNIDPTHHGNINNFARMQLTLEDFKNGWINYESRWGKNQFDYNKLNISKNKIWEGDKFEGTLIVHAEQGIGDEILFSSMFNDVIDFQKNVWITVDNRLIQLMQRSFPKIKFIDRKKTILTDKFAKHIYSGSLGKFFRNSIDDFKKNISPWLVANTKHKENFSKDIIDPKKINIGISWKTASLKSADKTISLFEFASIFLQNNFNLINLQYGEIDKEINQFHKKERKKILRIENFDYKNNVDELASLICCCDLIVSIDNVTAQLAGALGKPVFVLAPVGSQWYWHINRKDSIWYPKVRVFKQTSWRDWSDPLKKLKKEINNIYKHILK